MIELENHHLVTSTVISDSGKEYHYMLEFVSKSISYTVSKCLFKRYLFIVKEKNSNFAKGRNSDFTKEKSGRSYPTRRSVNNTSNRTNWHHVLLNILHWEGHNIPFVVSLPKTHNLNQILGKHQKNPNLGTFRKITD